MAVDILYVAYNRLAFTQPSFHALLANTDWTQVRALYIKDDGSTDGTAEWLRQAASHSLRLSGVDVVFDGERTIGPVAATNCYLDWHRDRAGGPEEPVEIFAKIDNDFVVCPGWLPEMLLVTTLYPHLDVLGMEPMFGPAVLPPHDEARFYRECEHIGGKGLIRHRVFERCRPVSYGFNGYQGWTQYQLSHHDLVCGWITPELPCFGLDQLPFAPWDELAQDYADEGIHRKWEAYMDDTNMKTYWAWWV